MSDSFSLGSVTSEVASSSLVHSAIRNVIAVLRGGDFAMQGRFAPRGRVSAFRGGGARMQCGAMLESVAENDDPDGKGKL